MDAQMKRGFIEASVLACLAREESYGYRIIRSVPPALELTESTLYPVLKRLEANGCVAVRAVDHNGRTRKYYRITSVGEERLTAFRAQRPQVKAVYDYIDAAAEAGRATNAALAACPMPTEESAPASATTSPTTTRFSGVELA